MSIEAMSASLILDPKIGEQRALAIAPAEDQWERSTGEECGVFGIQASGMDVGALAFQAAEQLRHRGLSGTGFAFNLAEGDKLLIVKGLGKPAEACPEMNPANGQTFADFMGAMSVISQNRYNTAPSNEASALHPFRPQRDNPYEFALGHNGNVDDLEPVAERYGLKAEDSDSDTHLMTLILGEALKQHEGDMKAALQEVLPQFRGAYCLTILYQDMLIAARDPDGTRPLSYAELRTGGHVIGSEPRAFEHLDITTMRTVEPGEVLILTPDQTDSFIMDRPAKASHCLYEWVYLAKSNIENVELEQARYNMGLELACSLRDRYIDVVIGVPDSGLPAAKGVADALGVRYENALVKNPDVERTFILRGHEREAALSRKFILDTAKIAGQRVLFVDDSIVKGNTARVIAQKLTDAGAAEVHGAFAGPPYRLPCYHGLDTADKTQLLAYGRSAQEVADELGITSVVFGETHTVEQAIDAARIDPKSASLLGNFCTGCANGRYPLSSSPVTLGRKIPVSNMLFASSSV
jgi:amidophosphoribosyltransferase